MKNLQEGDKVRIIMLNLCRKRVKYCFTGQMKEYCGKIATIEVVDGDLYKLDIDEGYFSWSIGMFGIGHRVLRNE